MAKKRTVRPFYTKRMAQTVKFSHGFPLEFRLAVQKGIADALKARALAHCNRHPTYCGH